MFAVPFQPALAFAAGGLITLVILIAVLNSLSSYNRQALQSRIIAQSLFAFACLKLKAAMMWVPGLSSLLAMNRTFKGELHIPIPWLQQLLVSKGDITVDQVVAAVSCKPLSGNRGLSGDMRVLSVTVQSRGGNDAEPTKTKVSYIVKATHDDSVDTVINNLLSCKQREAVFYKNFGAAPYLPRVLHTLSSPLTGSCVMIMEDLRKTCVGVNMLMGNQIWGVPEGLPIVSRGVVLKQVFAAAADLHARYWNDPALLSMRWLKACDWHAGHNRITWEIGLNAAVSAWKSYKASGNMSKVKWSPRVVELLDYATTNSSWEDLQTHFQDPTIPFTMIHGDFHAANMLWRKEQSENQLAIVDWPEVSVWEPMVDICQFVISDVKPEDRRALEPAALKVYWDTLIARGVSPSEFPFSACKRQYVRCGMEKWLWLLCLLAMYPLPVEALQFFHDQVHAFVEDNVSPTDKFTIKPVIVMRL
jgi:hypothetical protein